MGGVRCAVWCGVLCVWSVEIGGVVVRDVVCVLRAVMISTCGVCEHEEFVMPSLGRLGGRRCVGMRERACLHLFLHEPCGLQCRGG